MFSAELRSKAEQLVDRYPVGRSALLPLLHLVQHQDGYISDDGIAECAQLLGLTRAEVTAVATFYTMYKRQPLGRHLVSVCTNFACDVRGAGDVYRRLSDKLGVGHNETTADGAVTLEHAECLGNCEGAPVVTVDYFNYECLTPEAAEELVDRVIAGEVPPPTRGYRPRGILSAQHRLAGLGPHAADEPGAAIDQATSVDAAEPPPEAGPGAPGPLDSLEPDSELPEFADAAGGGAEQRGPEGMGARTGVGSDERGAATEADPRTDEQVSSDDAAEREGDDA
ncbi:MAG TPA: NAD(P)H-dependent oxidoreductase subunit E [Egibacteraceae bacterium]|nr:NAD(P)H-dependent oxidoreductase subunit E [Egibacteraceae bacterium]